MTEENKTTRTPVSEDAVKTLAGEIPRLHKQGEEADRGDLEETLRLCDQFVKIAEMRISFFEKIILLAGGSFALSVTFLGSLQRHNLGSPIKMMWGLEGSWVLLLVSICASWLHNRHRGFFIESIIFAGAARARSYHQTRRAILLKRAASAFKIVETPGVDLSAFFQTMAATSTESSSDADQMRERMAELAKKSMTTSGKLGDFALLAIACAFLLMLIFAVRNASLL
jgi:hypothetical protein